MCLEKVSQYQIFIMLPPVTKPNLLNFNNGFYDLTQHRFVAAVVDDNNEQTTGYNYVEYHKDSKAVQDARNFLDRLVTSREATEDLKRYCSCLLEGRQDHKMTFWYGAGRNTKNSLTQLLLQALGKYATKMSYDLINETNINVVQLGLVGKRLVVLEKSDSIMLNSGIMKELVSVDKVQARRLYEEPKQYTLQHKVLMCCDRFPAGDVGALRRIRSMKFEYSFALMPSSAELQELAPAFMWLLLNEVYPKYADSWGTY